MKVSKRRATNSERGRDYIYFIASSEKNASRSALSPKFFQLTAINQTSIREATLLTIADSTPRVDPFTESV